MTNKRGENEAEILLTKAMMIAKRNGRPGMEDLLLEKICSAALYTDTPLVRCRGSTRLDHWCAPEAWVNVE
jgi:hypothetical protein